MNLFEIFYFFFIIFGIFLTEFYGILKFVDLVWTFFFDYLRFFELNFFWFIIGFFVVYLKLIWLLLKVTKITTEHKKQAKTPQNALTLPEGQKQPWSKPQKKARVADCTCQSLSKFEKSLYFLCLLLSITNFRTF